jgi:hypothetical protein
LRPTFAEIAAKGPLRVSLTAALAPKALPRTERPRLGHPGRQDLHRQEGHQPAAAKAHPFAINANGTGAFAADVKLPEQSPFPSEGKMLAFNGRLRGQPAILAHIYGTVPASYTLPFTIKRTKGTYGTTLEANLPQISGEWGSIRSMSMTLGKSFDFHGKQTGYLTAACPAPKGFPGAVFPLARSSFEFAGGLKLASTLNRSCKVKG